MITWIQEKLKETDDLAAIAGSLVDTCLMRGSTDNMTAMLVQLVDGESYDKARIAARNSMFADPPQEDPEYIPGPFYYGEGDESFQYAYKEDAIRAGYALRTPISAYTTF